VRFEDLPRIDLVLVSHDHYDHLDLPTLRRLWQRDRPLIVTSLGNDTVIGKPARGGRARLGRILAIRPGVEVLIERNHHWSSRWMTDRNRALWSAFTIRLPAATSSLPETPAGATADGRARPRGTGQFRLAHHPDRRLRAARFHAHHHVNPEEAMAIFEDARPGAGARHSLGHLPAHLRADRSALAAARGAEAQTPASPPTASSHFRRAAASAFRHGSCGTMSVSAPGRIR
jgi:L-ascorbate metabolism protein UlaG (beta-lactamase superfamily)